jgi:hypothetical protein
MTNAERILARLDGKLSEAIELTLFGRAAILLGFEHPPEELALSRDIDAVFWIGQAEHLLATTNFWDAVEDVNRELADQDLYVSHFFTEDQVVLRPHWRECRVPLPGPWNRLQLHRLGNVDLLLSKLMRDDPLDQSDARLIVTRAGLVRREVEEAIREARLPQAEEVREQFALASERLLRVL